MEENVVLNYVRFQIWPDKNRYLAFASDGNKDELLVEGQLDQLTQHLPQIKDLYSGGSEANVILQWPESSLPASWFSKSIFRRFLSMVNSPELFGEITAIEDEMSQLEKARKYHLSLYSRGHLRSSGGGKTDDDNPSSTASSSKSESEVEIVSSDPSKIELLRAMDLRLKVLQEELAASLEQAASSVCSSKDVSQLVICCQTLGAAALGKYLIKYSELRQILLIVNNQSDEKLTLANAGVHGNYGRSLANAAHEESNYAIERDGSFNNGDVDAKERSRSLVSSATTRRSASPMRRIQIARVGSRKAATINIKSSKYFPGREKQLNHSDEDSNSSDEEESEKPQLKSETNAQRMSVQAAISLFESKQKEEIADVQNKSVGDVSKKPKAVLRKSNSCVEESHAQCSAEVDTENHSYLHDRKIEEVDVEEPASANVCILVHQADEIDETVRTTDVLESSDPSTHLDATATRFNVSTERLIASAEWNHQKEADFNELMKMIEVKPVRQRWVVTSKNKTSEQRGGLYDNYKKKRDEKLRVNNGAKQAEKEALFKDVHQVIEKSKVDLSSKDGRRRSLRRSLPSAIPLQFINPKKESKNDAKPITAKRGAAKPSSLPATRKSWPSTPLAQASEISPSSDVFGSSTARKHRHKSQPSQSLARPVSKVDKKPLPQKNAKGSRDNSNPTKPNTVPSSDDFSAMVPAKTALPSKGANRNSVMPVESKPFLSRGSKAGSAAVPTGSKSKTSPRAMESRKRPENTPCSQESEVTVQSPEQVDKHEIEYLIHNHEEPALVSETPENDDPKTPIKDEANGSTNSQKISDAFLTIEKEEKMISPSAWVEEEEEVEGSHELDIMPIPIQDSEVQFAYPPTITETASPRIRQSLSQMLQEEINEREKNTNWGNAEHPPVFHQKDAPKGLKRLLNFARKSKGDGSSSGWSSSPMFFDDEADGFNAVSPRNTDNRVRKAAHHSKSTSKYTQEISNNPRRSSYQMGEGHSSLRTSSTKSSRSFFSLSAFRGCN